MHQSCPEIAEGVKRKAVRNAAEIARTVDLALAQRAAIGRQDGRSLGVCWRKQGTQSLIRCLEHCIDYVSGRHELDYMSYGSRIDPEAAGQGSAPGRFAKP